MLLSHREMLKCPQRITQTQMDRGSDGLVLTGEVDGLIEIVLKFLRLAYNRQRPYVAGAKFSLKTKASPVGKTGSIRVGQGCGEKLVRCSWFDVLPKKQVAEGVPRESRTRKTSIEAIEMTTGLFEIALGKCCASRRKLEVIGRLLHVGFREFCIGGDIVSPLGKICTG